MNIIFMGTPEFAVPSLQALIASTEHTVKAIFTRAPKAQGRGMKLTNSPVHNIGIANNIIVFTPKSLKNPEVVDCIKNIQADIIIVVAYGFIIPENILTMKKYGCLNIHPSSLPKYRGAAPLQRTIINGEKETSVCVIQMDQGLDTGDIILKEALQLNANITLQELHDKCANLGSKLLLQALHNIDILPRVKQSSTNISYAEKLKKEEGFIDWQDSAWQIDCKVRGMTPWPGVYFKYNNKRVKILETSYVNQPHDLIPGTIINNDCQVACQQGFLLLKCVKPENKQQMSGADYLRGIRANNKNQIILLDDCKN
ncbi:MAG: methionyl-tRNA formyltransferase [Rickettsiaceae bacterium]